MRLRDREALKDWEVFVKTVMKATEVDYYESIEAQSNRKSKLLNNIEAFAKYYFPHYCQSDFAPFHKRFFKRVIESPRIFLTRAWARAHAKSVCAGVILPIFLMCNGDLKNMILASYSESNATELLKSLKTELEYNQRLIHDFGPFKSSVNWEAEKFVTIDGVSFRAIGLGQSPRGTRNQEARPDYILCDDLDEDELARNPKRMDKAYEWMIGALYGCFDITGKGRFIVVNNIIAKDTLLKRAIKVSHDHEQIDILNKDGQPSWSERYTLKECQEVMSIMGYRLSQREYFNNPIAEGKVFKKDWMQFKKLPSLNKYTKLVAYLDPGFKKTATSDSKALVLVGVFEGAFHVRKAFVGKASVEEMIEWGYVMHEYVKRHGGTYRFKMEEVFLQSLLYKDFAEAAKTKGYPLPVSGDTRKKPDKDARIEAISGYFERGQIFFDKDIEEEHHTNSLIEQLINFEPGVKSLKDGPDALEGAIHILQNLSVQASEIIVVHRSTNPKFK